MQMPAVVIRINTQTWVNKRPEFSQQTSKKSDVSWLPIFYQLNYPTTSSDFFSMAFFVLPSQPVSWWVNRKIVLLTYRYKNFKDTKEVKNPSFEKYLEDARRKKTY